MAVTAVSIEVTGGEAVLWGDTIQMPGSGNVPEGEAVTLTVGATADASRALVERDVGVAAIELGAEQRDTLSDVVTTNAARLC